MHWFFFDPLLLPNIHTYTQVGRGELRELQLLLHLLGIGATPLGTIFDLLYILVSDICYTLTPAVLHFGLLHTIVACIFTYS